MTTPNKTLQALSDAWEHYNGEEGCTHDELIMLFRACLIDRVTTRSDHVNPVTISRNDSGWPVLEDQAELRQRLLKNGVKVITVDGIGLVDVPELTQSEMQAMEFAENVGSAYHLLPGWCKKVLRRHWQEAVDAGRDPTDGG